MPSEKTLTPTICFGDISREEINTTLNQAGVSLSPPRKIPFALGVKRKTKKRLVINGPPAVPSAAPAIPASLPLESSISTAHSQEKSKDDNAIAENAIDESAQQPNGVEVDATKPIQNGKVDVTPSTPKVKPSSWAALLKSSDSAKVKPNAALAKPSQVVKPAKVVPPAASIPRLSGIGDMIQNYQPSSEGPLLEPRGLINNVNTCFMNVILQPLSHCPPFYNLFKDISTHVAHTFKSKTPLTDSIIEFINEFRLQPKNVFQNEEYGEPFVPEYVYDALRGKKRFDSLKGRQEDAEEFLCFLLDGLHEEMVSVLKEHNEKLAKLAADGTDDEWLEVGPKNKTSNLRSTGFEESPISNIFGGKIRSVLRCPGAKDSANLEPFQSLPLDIQPENVASIQDAIHNMTVPEIMHDFMSHKGVRVEATKQIFFESLPLVLVLHLKRFVFDNVGGVQKLQKHVTYEPQLTIDREWMTPAARTSSPITYQLFGVIYHHGASAGGGHYTCDIKRQNGEWLHIDDTAIIPVSQEDVLVTEENTRTSEKLHTDQTAYILFYMRT
ncbi:uncharacterized protein BYT42DRAFT_585532 [Radiomyces spectabilis]|uniref:uncharacterized protein n=1 Tax=Radiomyces spectabilis TaxID=64574 RepID=UPI0022202AB8|nr:uncharacterized protein BYT42DRAFT_585532 [Radiomyces spectabilis]KAI8368165.1 hypothetical protein BYT42DRAFT_585532 [Radiomyces spectabilis]